MGSKGKKIRKIIRATAVCLTAFATAFTMAGCANSVENRAENLSNSLLTACNEQIVEYNPDYTMQDFRIIGADVNKTAFEFDVNFNGIASFSDESVGYTSVNYTVPSSYFTNLEKDSRTEDVFNVFDSIVANLKPNEIAVSPVSDLIKVNDAFVRNEPQIFENHKNNRALVFNLGVPEFDDATNTINFDMKTLVETRKGKVQPGIGIGIGFSGGAGMGIGIHASSAEGTFVTTNNYKFTVDKETYDKMKNDHSLVYDYCVEAINNKDSSKISAERLSTTSVSFTNADLLNELNIKNIAKEMSE